mmetsp:Transcript_3847/g.4428  ORF Transcript_3847/g.4428 Transcript_3847/m.4428 type:complete len:447 (+) Transcript_3847:2-1342(+)|eukprot:CAMPEP_0184024912 /NCGR_PEP_ID=MMETSP0954-20121128/12436_1 /TAXON_ID=627963 /ORGANISM="Aplanochytrium sp, Strain PBS07" /LENGTH=446 /DNA_ID=CAMNT_0026308473 /DNA_START=1 /DNA_END=1341 /DNA_ORIENTATION=+
MNLRSKLWIPMLREIPASATLRSHRMLLRGGYFSQSSSGIFSTLPLGKRVLEKLEGIIDAEMQTALSASKVSLPSILSAESWKVTGRWESTGDELFRLKDRRDNDFCLGPTHEETISDLVASFGVQSHKQLPIKLYQITSKFRDEIRPRFGLLRGREFLMKDMYSFHSDLEDISLFYNQVCASYENILNHLELDFVQVKADTGNIGGNHSHEYHIIADAGEDDLVCCDTGDYSVNIELLEIDPTDFVVSSCSEPSCSCGGSGRLHLKKGIEIGHCFILGTKYSEPLKVLGINADQKRFPLIMGCYGIGVSRMMAAAIESGTVGNDKTNDDSIVWPEAIAPYEMVILTAPGKAGERQGRIDLVINDILPNLMSRMNPKEIIVDDRWNESLGKKLTEASLVGYNYVTIVGKRGIEVLHPRSSGSRTFQHASDYVDWVATAINKRTAEK